MAWPDMRRSGLGSAVAAVGVVVVVGGGIGALHGGEVAGLDSPLVQRSERLEAVDRTLDLLASRDEIYRSRARARLRALQRLEPLGLAGLWFRAEERFALLTRRDLLARLVRRDLSELQILADETQQARRARDRATRELTAVDPTRQAPPPRSLQRPVKGAVTETFGRRRDGAGRTWLNHRGIRMQATSGDLVASVAAGRVAWVGPVATSGRALLIEHPALGIVSFMAGLGDAGVAVGSAIAAGQVLGHAQGPDLYLEIRLGKGDPGYPVDPEPLLAP